MENMAWDGDWRPFFYFIAETLRRFSSQRDKQKGEAYVHGFTLAQTCLTNFYLPDSELDAGPVSRIGPKSGVYSPKSEVHSPKSEVYSPKSEVYSPKSEVYSPKSEV
jgi:hypothetical protein